MSMSETRSRLAVMYGVGYDIGITDGREGNVPDNIPNKGMIDEAVGQIEDTLTTQLQDANNLLQAKVLECEGLRGLLSKARSTLKIFASPSGPRKETINEIDAALESK